VTFDAQRLYELLPAIHRIRDAELNERRQSAQDAKEILDLRTTLAGIADQTSLEAQRIREELNRRLGGPLRSLLAVIAEQAEVLEESLAQLYDDQFAETCASWVLPYIGDLIGITGLPGSAVQALSPRAEVAHTIGYRRRKGTIAMLEQLARDVSGWPARGVELFDLLAATQYMNHLRPENQSFISIRGAERLEFVGGPFERGATRPDGPRPESGGALLASTQAAPDLTHTVDVRRIASGRGRYNIPNVGIFVWRLQSVALTRSPAVPAASGDRRRFLFSPLGVDAPLFNLPQTETEATHLAEPINVPDRITRRVLARNLNDYYGSGLSLLIELGDADTQIEPTPIASDRIVVCDLTGWVNLPAAKIAIDPVLGRIAFPSDEAQDVLVTFHYGFATSMGGGEYSRPGGSASGRTRVLDDGGTPVLKEVVNTYLKGAVDGAFTSIQSAVDNLGSEGGVVEILNSGRYAETLTVNATGKHVTIRAADKRRPTVVLGADLSISGGPNDDVQLDGLLISGGALKVAGQLGRLRLAHCTLVPGIELSSNGTPAHAATPSLVVDSENTRIEIDHCILGGILARETTEVVIQDSIVDATDATGIAFAGTTAFGGPLRVTNSTIIGRVRTSILRLASNAIFMAAFPPGADAKTLVGPVLAERRQEGCVRFSYLSPGARVPARFHCQPETDDALVRPQFVSTRFHDPGYCQLRAGSPSEIWQGADDEAEMGAFHDLFEPQRAAHLLTRIEEYLRFGLEAGVFYAT
jgi:hypothetical protein